MIAFQKAHDRRFFPIRGLKYSIKAVDHSQRPITLAPSYWTPDNMAGWIPVRCRARACSRARRAEVLFTASPCAFGPYQTPSPAPPGARSANTDEMRDLNPENGHLIIWRRRHGLKESTAQPDPTAMTTNVFWKMGISCSDLHQTMRLREDPARRCPSGKRGLARHRSRKSLPIQPLGNLHASRREDSTFQPFTGHRPRRFVKLASDLAHFRPDGVQTSYAKSFSMRSLFRSCVRRVDLPYCTWVPRRLKNFVLKNGIPRDCFSMP